MNTLFPVETGWPEGFQYWPEFLNPEEERILLEEIEKTELHTFIFQGYEAKRKVASFGYDYSFDKKALTKGKPIPPAFGWLIEKACKQTGVDAGKIGELLLIEYPEESVMNWHRDAPPFGVIIGVSLLSDCLFKFRPQEKEKQGRGSVITVPMKRRSLYIMQGASRSEWQHSVAAVKKKRYSITLRTLAG